MIRPQWCLDNARCHRRNANPEELVEFGHGAHETTDTVFGGRVDRSSEGRILPGNTGNVDNMLALLRVALT